MSSNPFCGPQPCHWECPPALLYCDSYCQPADLRTVPVTMAGWTDEVDCTCSTLNDTFLLQQMPNPCVWYYDPEDFFYPCAEQPFFWTHMSLNWYPPGVYIVPVGPDPTKATLSFELRWPVIEEIDAWIKQYAMSELPIDCKAPITLDRYKTHSQFAPCGNQGPATVQVN